MIRYNHLKMKAVTLRESGMALPEICNRLSLSKSTVYYWIRKIKIPRTNNQRLCVKRMTEARVRIASERRSAWYKEGVANYSSIVSSQKMRDFVILYMAEGFRRSQHMVSLCNSDPKIIKLSHECIQALKSKNKPIYSVQIHVDNDERQIKSFWSNLLNIPQELIRTIRKSNSGKLSGRQWRSVHGVFQVGVCDTHLKCWIQAWMDLTRQSWDNGA